MVLGQKTSQSNNWDTLKHNFGHKVCIRQQEWWLVLPIRTRYTYINEKAKKEMVEVALEKIEVVVIEDEDEEEGVVVLRLDGFAYLMLQIHICIKEKVKKIKKNKLDVLLVGLSYNGDNWQTKEKKKKNNNNNSKNADDGVLGGEK